MIQKKCWLAALFLLLGLLALGYQNRWSLTILTVNLPSYLDASTRHADLSYGTQPQQKLDLYLPYGASAETPVLIFFHGGRWTVGSKEQYRFVAHRFTQLGYAVAIPDYAKFPQVKFPVFVEDAAAAVGWLLEHLKDYGLSAKTVYVSGHSAGAHLGALIATDKHYLAKEGSSTGAIAAFCGLAGPYAFTPDEPDLIAMFGPPRNYPLMQAPTFIDGTQPPMLLLTGERDTDVKEINRERVVKAVRSAGGIVETKSYATDHIGVVAALSWFGPKDTPVAEDCDAFFRKHQKKD